MISQWSRNQHMLHQATRSKEMFPASSASEPRSSATVIFGVG